MWNAIGLTLALAVAVLAWLRSRKPGGYYDAAVYGMTPLAHRRYALLSLAFGAFFGTALLLRSDTAGLIGLALYAVIAVFYGASFLRGSVENEQ